MDEGPHMVFVVVDWLAGWLAGYRPVLNSSALKIYTLQEIGNSKLFANNSGPYRVTTGGRKDIMNYTQ